MRKTVLCIFGLLALMAGLYLLRPSNQLVDKKEDVAAASSLVHSPPGPQKPARPFGSLVPPDISVPVSAEIKATPALTAQLEAYKKAFESADYGLTNLYSKLLEELKSDPVKMPM